MKEARLGCRRCLLQEAGETGTLQSVQDSIAQLPASLRVSEAEYRRRLALCRGCDHLLSGTCLLCGCYVELRAAMAEQSCPQRPKRWDRIHPGTHDTKTEGR